MTIPPKYLSRRFLLAAFTIASASLLVAFGRITEAGYSTVVIAALGITAANKYLDRRAEVTK